MQIRNFFILQNVYAAHQREAWKEAGPSTSSFDRLSTSSSTGRPSAEFEEASERTKRRKTATVRSQLSATELAYATQMSLRSSGANNAANVVRDVTQKSPSRASKYKAALKLAAIPPVKRMSPEAALSDMVEAKLTKHQYEVIRRSMSKNNALIYPCYDYVLKAKNCCYPSDITVTEISAEVKLQALLDHTFERILMSQLDVLATFSKQTVSSLKCMIKWGCDGSSGQSEYKQKFSDGNSSDANVFLTSLVPLQIVGIDNESNEEVVVWKNPTPSSPRFCRPIRLQFLHEDVQSTLNEQRYIEDQIASLVPFKTTHCGNVMFLSYKLIFSMIDGKVCNALTETKSAMRCYLCGATSKEFNNIDMILEKEVDVLNFRFGLSTLHAWINFFECLLHVSYKLNIKKWQARSPEEKQLTADRKKSIQEGFREKLGLLIDRPKAGFGNTNDGNTARRFFENSLVTASILGIDVDFINRFHVILQVMSSGLPVNVDAFKTYCLDTARIFVEKYPWYYMPTTVHKVLIHASQIIEYAPLPIGQLSEDAQEARNKDIKKYRESFSRKFSREKTMLDVFHWLLISSDPFITNMRKTHRKKVKKLSPEAIELLLLRNDSECSDDSDTSVCETSVSETDSD